jgi:diacylglycerol kinase family enzyme
MRRLLLISNPVAARTDPASELAVLEVLQRGDWQVELARTTGHGDARRLAAQGVADGMEVIAVLGGDGTTMQAASALVGTGVALGVIPGGTGNLLAGNLRIPSAPVAAARALLTAHTVRLDLGKVERADGPHFFGVAAGVGYDARVMGATDAAGKRRWGMGAYVASTFRMMPHLRSVIHRVTVDGVSFDAPATLVLIANCAEIFPPYIRLRRDVSPNDGLLDVFLVRADGFWQAIRAIWHVLIERNVLAGERGLVAHVKGREVRIEPEHPEPVELDGDAVGESPFVATVVPGAISVLARNSV